MGYRSEGPVDTNPDRLEKGDCYGYIYRERSDRYHG